MSYTLIKMLHLTAVAMWIGAMFWQAWRLISPAGHGDERLKRAVRVNRFVVLPAMVLTWIFGLDLALRGGWFASHWIFPKLAFVVSLSGIYLAQSLTLSRRARGDDRWSHAVARFGLPWTVIAAGSAIALALLKPF